MLHKNIFIVLLIVSLETWGASGIWTDEIKINGIDLRATHVTMAKEEELFTGKFLTLQEGFVKSQAGKVNIYMPGTADIESADVSELCFNAVGAFEGPPMGAEAPEAAKKSLEDFAKSLQPNSF